MSVLETFYILFKSNGAQAADEIEKVDDASDKAEKGLKKVDKAADQISKSFIAMAKNLAAPLLALASFGSLTALATQRAQAVRELDAMSVKLNSSISDVDAFQRSIKGLGGETAGALDSLSKIGEKVNEAFADKESGARKDFKEWGLAFRDTKGEALGATEAMLELAGNLEKVSNAEALARIKKLGIEDATTIEALMLGRATLEEHLRVQKEMGVVTEENAAAVRDYYAALGDAQNLLTSIGNKILATFLPIATRGVEIFGTAIKWMIDHQKLVEGFFTGLATVLAVKYTPAMIRAAWATAAALWPYLAIIAVIGAVGAAFALAYEDVDAFMSGQPSLIGELAKKYEWFGDFIKKIGELFTSLGEAADWLSSTDAGTLGEIVRTLSGLDGLEAAALGVGALTLALSPLARTLFLFALAFYAAKAGLDYLSNYETNIGGPEKFAVENPRTAPGYVESGGYDDKGQMIYEDGQGRRVDRPDEKPQQDFSSDALDYKFKLMEEEGQKLEDTMNRARGMLDNAANASISTQTAATVTQPVTNNEITNTVNVGSVAVHTQAVDAQGMAAAARSALKKELQTTASQLDDGVQN